MSSFPQPGPKTIGKLWEFWVPRTNRQSKMLERAFHQRTCNHEPPAIIWYQHREELFQYCTTWSSPAQKISMLPQQQQKGCCVSVLSKHGSQPTWSLKIDPWKRICKSTSGVSSSLNCFKAPLRFGLLVVKNYQGTSPIKLWTHIGVCSVSSLRKKTTHTLIYIHIICIYINRYIYIYVHIYLHDRVPCRFLNNS